MKYTVIWRDFICGICGYITKENITEDKIIYSMISKLTNTNKYIPEVYINNNATLGMLNYNSYNLLTRIIKNNEYTIVFDGKIDNLDIIKEDLKNFNYELITSNALEIILLSYIHYGNEFLNKLDGVFSLAIYDKSKGRVFIARDRLGIKPLFYFYDKDFIFASEIKSILEHPNVTAKIGKDEICEIFGLGPAHSPGKTFFKNIYEILPGHYAIYDKSGFHTYKYWDLETYNVTDTAKESISKVRELVSYSLKKQLASDTPICSMLSGGLDSSVLALLASKHINDLATFSIDFEENKANFTGSDYQPTRDSDFVVIMRDFLKTNHTNIYFSTSDIFNSLKDVVIARDMPGMADVDSSMLVFCKKIKASGYNVVLSGECSDEIFGGYPWYYKEHLTNSKNFPWSRSIDTRINIINKELVSPEYLENYIDNAFKTTSNNVVYNSSDEMENTYRKTCYNTVKWFMNTLIERTDRMSKLAGLEVRVPFADYKIFEYVYNVCAKYKLGLINGNNTPIEKYLLRKAFEDELPHDVVYRKKSPFPKTYDPKYTKLLEDSIKDIINKSTSPILELIDLRYLYDILRTHGENLKENWFGQLMTYPQTLAYLIQVNMWLEEYKPVVEI